ncbi:protein FAM200B [Trichonephila clavipes]|nr:protein FAM200B [Trichonephila clavipes]
MDKFLSRKRTFDDSKASTSAQASIVSKIKSRKYSQEYLNFGFTITEVNGEEKPLCVICSKILAADSMKPNKLKRHFETLHVNEKALLTSYKVSYEKTKCKKRHTIAEELILPATIEIVETVFGDNFAKELQSIPLSNDTVSRRIDDVTEDVEQQLFEWKNCVGICTDDARTMSGRFKSIQALVKQKSPLCIWTHCMIHREELWLPKKLVLA